jgi:hypothetical protein
MNTTRNKEMANAIFINPTRNMEMAFAFSINTTRNKEMANAIFTNPVRNKEMANAFSINRDKMTVIALLKAIMARQYPLIFKDYNVISVIARRKRAMLERKRWIFIFEYK